MDLGSVIPRDPTMSCPQCGATIEADAQFCPECFARIEPPGFWRKLFSAFRGPAKPRRPVVHIEKRVTIKTTDPQGRQHEYHSLDDVPPELRGEIEKLQAEAMKQRASSTSSTTEGFTTRIVSRKSVSVYKLKDASGQERIYHSLEEMPPELRAAVEQARRKANE
jgi:hypothetical protein